MDWLKGLCPESCPLSLHTFFLRQLTSEGHKRLNEIRANTVWKRCIALTSKIIGKGVGAVLTAVIGIVVTTAFGVYLTKQISQWLQ